MTKAVLFDGRSALGQSIEVEPSGEGAIRLVHHDGTTESINTKALRLQDEPQAVRLTLDGRPGWSVKLSAPLSPALAAALPSMPIYGRWIDRIGLKRSLAIGAVITGLVLVAGYTAPEWIAPLIPPSTEHRIGNALIGEFDAERCTDPEGNRALNVLVAKLDPAATGPGGNHLRVIAIDADMLNAMALPGGTIIVFNGAIQNSGDVDALAGILAHEIAHERRRHPLKAVIRELGVGSIMSLLGGNFAANAHQLAALSYTRHDEAEADDDAIRTLRKAGISPAATGRLFNKLSSEDPELSAVTAFLSSHPMSKDRARKFSTAVEAGREYRPALEPADAKALRQICS